MGDEHVAEASWAAQMTAGLSAYFHGVGYSKEAFQQEVDAVVDHIQNTV